MMRPCVMQSQPEVNVFAEGFQRSWEMISAQTKEILINERCTECKYRPICNTCCGGSLLETGDYEEFRNISVSIQKNFTKL